MTRINSNQQKLKSGWNFRKGASARQQGYFAYFYIYWTKSSINNAMKLSKVDKKMEKNVRK